jgi:hypothetical protein
MVAYWKEEAMLRSSEGIYGYTILANDGPIGTVDDFYFDDRTWTIRYLVADVGTFLDDRRVLLSPEALGRPDWSSAALPVNLTKEQIERSPDVDQLMEVGSEREAELRSYYGWPAYWAAWTAPGGTAAYWPASPEVTPQPAMERTHTVVTDRPRDPHLRSAKEVSGYKIEANDGTIGHVDHFVFDDEGWEVRYLVVKTRDFLPGKSVLISPEWVSAITWDDNHVSLDLTREQIKNAPEYDATAPVNREYEERLYDYYGRPGYWF